MKATDQHDSQLIQSLKDATQPEAQKPIPLTDDLKQIGVDASHIAGSTFDELMGGEGRNTRDRMASSKNPIKLVWEKLKKIRSAQQKAA